MLQTTRMASAHRRASVSRHSIAKAQPDKCSFPACYVRRAVTAPSQQICLQLRFRRARTWHKNPPRPEVRKKTRKHYKIPHPGLGSENMKKLPKKCKTDNFCIFAVIFSYFRSPTQGGGFCNFSVFFFIFPASEGFVPCTSPTASQVYRPKDRGRHGGWKEEGGGKPHE